MKSNAQPACTPQLICLSGIDGSGKSSVCTHLQQRFATTGRKVTVKWLRYNHVLSKPLLGLCRLLGLTRYVTVNGITVGYHDFHRSRIVAWLFVLFQYLDALRVLHFKVRPSLKHPNEILILDRYVYDILVDIMVDTGFTSLATTGIGKAFLRLMPEGARVLLVDRDLHDVLDARPEGRVDENFSKRYHLYKQISSEDGVLTIVNSGSLHELLSAAEAAVGLK